MNASMSGKLIVVLKGYPRLSETFIAQELLGLQRAGIPLAIVSLRHPTDTSQHTVHDEITAPVLYLPEYLHEEPVRVLKALLKCLGRAGFWKACVGFVTDLAHDFTRNRFRRFGQALVLANEWPESGIWLYAHFIHTPASVADYASQITSVGWSVSAHAKDIWTSAERELSAKLGRARWAVTCTGTGHHYLQSLAVDPTRVHLSYHGIDLERFPSFQRSASQSDGSDPSATVNVLSVGRAVKKKGLDTLLQALAALPKTLHWHFTHIGGGTELEKLQKLAETLGIAQQITWLGAVTQSVVLEHYQRSDLFALACRITEDGDRDGLPNVLVEAASQGLTCITTHISAIPEAFEHQRDALLVEPDNVEELRDAIELLMTDPSLRWQLGQNAAKNIRSRFDHHASISQLLDLFAGVQVNARQDITNNV